MLGDDWGFVKQFSLYLPCQLIFIFIIDIMIYELFEDSVDTDILRVY